MLTQYGQTLKGKEAYCFQAFAEALEVIPTTLAENAGLNPIAIVTELRNRHALGEKNAGINVRKGLVSNILEENVLQPLLVSTSAIELATETVALILRIDDIQVSNVVCSMIAQISQTCCFYVTSLRGNNGSSSMQYTEQSRAVEISSPCVMIILRYERCTSSYAGETADHFR